MIHYFGYGSNIHSSGMLAKGISVLASQRAVLHDWKLCFNVKHWFRHEGTMANAMLQHGHAVKGSLHTIATADLKVLDIMESNGVGYDRVLLPVSLEDGTEVQAFVYVGRKDYLSEEERPTRRYLSIIIQGAENMALDAAYVQQLKSRDPWPMPHYPPFAADDRQVRSLLLNEVQEQPMLTALAGYVFDMSEVSAQMECVRPVFGSKDVTPMLLRRHHLSKGSETTQDYFSQRLPQETMQYIQAYLHEFNREFQLVGAYQH
jgi:cation transport regulator ChaC